MELISHIAVKDVSFRYSAKAVLEKISFNIARGEVLAILGPNGCGKSTLIKIILGFLTPESGSIMFKGRNIADINARCLAREVAYVPQTHKSTFPYMVMDVVLMGRIPHKSFFFKYSRDDRDIAYEALERLSIRHLADRVYTDLSGGERQLTIIARALAQGAKTFIMDEPAAGLDYGNQVRLLEVILQLAGEGYTFIKSTHSPEHALWIADRVIIIKEGAIMADGSAKDVVTSNNLHSLYKINVNIEDMHGSSCVCVPQGACR
jgi:iron complex transport system ATP-binding protein